jgi:hypothetical protein
MPSTLPPLLLHMHAHQTPSRCLLRALTVSVSLFLSSIVFFVPCVLFFLVLVSCNLPTELVMCFKELVV